MSAFVAMRHFMIQNAGILMRLAHLERHNIATAKDFQIFRKGFLCFVWLSEIFSVSLQL